MAVVRLRKMQRKRRPCLPYLSEVASVANSPYLSESQIGSGRGLHRGLSLSNCAVMAVTPSPRISPALRGLAKSPASPLQPANNGLGLDISGFGSILASGPCGIALTISAAGCSQSPIRRTA